VVGNTVHAVEDRVAQDQVRRAHVDPGPQRALSLLELPGPHALASFDGIIEAFNLFNHENYAAFTTNEASASYGRPTESLNVSYQPRMLQFGFRASF
jgi:hypothetical protein